LVSNANEEDATGNGTANSAFFFVGDFDGDRLLDEGDGRYKEEVDAFGEEAKIRVSGDAFVDKSCGRSARGIFGQVFISGWS
jgi:hypothetical protein